MADMLFIVARATNGVIAKDGDVPWQISEDLKRFKKLTIGKPMIMGRKTYETFAKPLPNRRHIVITRQADYQAPEGVEVVHSLDDAIALCQNEEQVFVIGGAEIYRQAYDKCDLLYLTIVHASFEGDTYLNCIDLTQWDKIEEESFNADDKNPLDYTCYLYHRKST